MAPTGPETAELSARIDWYEKYLDRILSKSETSKQDLEKNWMGQITVVALSLALFAGFGGIVARKLFEDADRYTILYLILPAVNTFLFVRFGLIGATFSKARYNAERLSIEIGKLRSLPDAFDVSQIYKTNSYFEWAHQKLSKETILFLLTIPIVFSSNHALSIYLIYKFLGINFLFISLFVLYAAVCSICYWSYYTGNKANTPVLSGSTNFFILATIAIAVASTVAMLVALHHYDPQPGRMTTAAALKTAPTGH